MKWKAFPTLFFLIVYSNKSRKNLPLFIFIKLFGYVLLLFARKFLTDKLLMESGWKFYCLSLLPTHMTELHWNILKRKKLKHSCQEMKIGVITFLLKELYTRCCSERWKQNIRLCKIIYVLKWRYTIYDKYLLHRQ